MSSSFKEKKSKKITLSKQIITLDSKHNEIIEEYRNIGKSVRKNSARVESIEKHLDKIDPDSPSLSYYKYQDELNDLNTDFFSLQEDQKEKMSDYILNAHSCIFDYYNVQNDTEEVVDDLDEMYELDAETKEMNKEKSSDNIMNYVSSHLTSQQKKSTIMNDYLGHINSESYELDYCNKTVDIICEKCNVELIVNTSEGMQYCPVCYMCQNVVIDNEQKIYLENMNENGAIYKRINHFKEWLNQFQARNNKEIPSIVYDYVLVELKKQRETNLATLTQERMRIILKKLKFNKHYDLIPNIINKLNKLPPPVINREIEEKLITMFKEIQPAFELCCPTNRKNFLSYSYVLNKLTKILELREFHNMFSLLKSREKLKQQDMIWKCITKILRWDYHPSI